MVRRINSDLNRLGVSTWLDEIEILAGDSIVDRITEGLQTNQFLLLFLSPHSVSSGWVRREWQSSLARQLDAKQVTIIPVLIEPCEIPAILADLKYADFSQNYRRGLDDLLKRFRAQRTRRN